MNYKIMRIWTKISSFAIIIFFIYGVVYSYTIYINLLVSPIQTGMTSLLFYVIIENILSIFIFAPPLFYFGWIKKPKNELMKIWAKLLTFLLPLLIAIGFISPLGLDFPKDLFGIIPSIIVLAPLYYYAWKK